MIAYLLGIVCIAFVPDLQWLWWVVPGLLLVMLCPPARKSACLLLAGILVAASYGGWQLHHRFDQAPRDISFHAEIVELPEYHNGRYSLLLKPVRLAAMPADLQHLRLIKASYFGGDIRFSDGDRLLLDLRLKPPGGLSNPAAFDLELYYLSRGIDARGYIRRIYEHEPAEPGMRFARQSVADYLDETFTERSAATLRALVLGDRSHLTPEQWEALRVTGTAHLFVVSGLHVAVISALGWGLGRLVQGCLLLMSCRAPVLRMLPGVVALVVAAGYAWLSGWGVPVQRAWLMLAVFMVGSWFLHPLSGWRRWRLALLAVVTLQPLSVLQVGVWLSFGAVALILWLWQCRVEQGGMRQRLGVVVGLQLVLFIGMLPLMAAAFNQLSMLSVPVNLVAVPVFSILVWLLPALFALVFFVPSSASLLDRGVEGLWWLLSWLAEVPGLHASVSSATAFTILFAGLAVALLLLPMPLVYRMLVLPMLIPLLSPKMGMPAENTFVVTMFDVGQGQAILVETAGGALLYDTGPGYSSGGAAFPYAIRPLLDSRGIRHLDTLIISHGDSDHAGGYGALAKHVTYGRLFAGEPESTQGAERCVQQQWRMGGVGFGFQQAFAGWNDLSSNNRSCILRVDNGRCSLLLTGDLDTSGEYRMLSAGYRHPVTWLVAGHHGSRDSTTGALLDLLQPELVLISAGRYNRFGHPHAEVVERLEARSIRWAQTAEVGAIKLVADLEHCEVRYHRKQKKRYWTAS